MDAITSVSHYDTLLEELAQDRSEADGILLRRAFGAARQGHHGQMRASGEPYISHCLATAQILAELRMDTPTVAAALLHDLVEDTPYTQQMLEAEFGGEIAKLVDGVTKLGQIDQLSGMSERNIKAIDQNAMSLTFGGNNHSTLQRG